MNFLIVRDFFRIFIISNELIWIYFKLNRIKNQISSHDNVADDIVWAKWALPRGGE